MNNEHRYTEKGIAYSNTRLYKVWESMKARCNTPSHTSYKHYGAKGITVCEEWAGDFGSFRKWAMETGYDEEAPSGNNRAVQKYHRTSNKENAECRVLNAEKNLL